MQSENRKRQERATKTYTHKDQNVDDGWPYSMTDGLNLAFNWLMFSVFDVL